MKGRDKGKPKDIHLAERAEFAEVKKGKPKILSHTKIIKAQSFKTKKKKGFSVVSEGSNERSEWARGMLKGG